MRIAVFLLTFGAVIAAAAVSTSDEILPKENLKEVTGTPSMGPKSERDETEQNTSPRNGMDSLPLTLQHVIEISKESIIDPRSGLIGSEVLPSPRMSADSGEQPRIEKEEVMIMNTISGHTVTRYEGEGLASIGKEFPGMVSLHNNGWVRLNPGNWTLPNNFDQVADQTYQFKFRKGDIVVNSCPMAGNTWMQEIVWTMMNNPNLDNPDANLSMEHRSPHLDIDAAIGTKGPIFENVRKEKKSQVGEMKDGEGIFMNMLNALPSPRIINTHHPLTLLPPDTLDIAKVVYVARNPLDVCIHYFHICRLMNYYKYSGTFAEFAQRFMDGDIVGLPFWKHVYEAWKIRNNQNHHFLFYEDLKQNPIQEISKLNLFLETNLTEKQLENVVDFTHFSEMAKRGVLPTGVDENPDHINMELKEKEGGLLAKENVGEWKNSSDQETISKLKVWIDSSMKDMAIPFKYEIE